MTGDAQRHLAGSDMVEDRRRGNLARRHPTTSENSISLVLRCRQPCTVEQLAASTPASRSADNSGDNLYAASRIGINPENGEIKWHFPDDAARRMGLSMASTKFVAISTWTRTAKPSSASATRPTGTAFFYVLNREERCVRQCGIAVRERKSAGPKASTRTDVRSIVEEQPPRSNPTAVSR